MVRLVDERPLLGVAIHRAAIRITENRKPVGVIASTLPMDPVGKAGLRSIGSGLYVGCRRIEAIAEEVVEKKLAGAERKSQSCTYHEVC